MRKSIALLILLFARLAAPQPVTAIKAGRLIDPQSGTVQRNAIIVIRSGKIEAVGESVSVPNGAAVIDLSAKTVMPGLFDVHTHLCTPPLKVGPALATLPIPVRWETGGSPAFFLSTLLNPTGYRAIVGVKNARDMLESGFTTVRDVGHAGNYADTDLRRAIEEGLVPGPTIINSGKKICAYGGQFTLQQETREAANADYIYADTRDEMLKAIRENIHYGAKVIKIVAAGQRYIYSAADIRFIVEESARAGLKVAADCSTAAGSHNAAEGGVASIEHGAGLTDDDLELVKRNRVTLIMNVPSAKFTKAMGLASDGGWREGAIAQMKNAHKHGATFAFGTDTAFSYEGKHHGQVALDFLESYVDAGFTPVEVLRIMIPNSARLAGVEKERGAVRAGQAADLVAMPGDPLADIFALRQIDFVMKDGRRIR